MRIFFAKISNRQELGNQFDNGFYLSQKGSAAYGDLNGVEFNTQPIYVFAICGNQIGLWRAIRWETNESKLHFEIIIPVTGLSSKSLTAFKYFLLNKDLIVFPVRQAQKSFFELTFQPALTEQILIDRTTYSNAANFRKICIINDTSQRQQTNDIDLVLLKSANGLTFPLPSNFDASVFQSFRDNLGISNGSQPNKDKTILQIANVVSFPQTFSYDIISILQLYDAFFCEYRDNAPVEGGDVEPTNEQIETKFIMDAKSLNQILFGPPGTGKTYNTINLAVKLAYPDKFIEFKVSNNENPQEREFKRIKLTKFFRENLYDPKNKIDGRIAFTTFHQSMGYEDFIEGIKPVDPKKSNEEFLVYSVEPGIFKDFCIKARDAEPIKKPKISESEFDSARFVKLNFTTDNKDLVKDCIINNFISFFPEIPFDLTNQNEVKNKHRDHIGNIKDLIAPFNPSKPLFVILTLNENECFGVGKIIGEYKYNNENKYKHIRDVEWIRSTSFPTPEILKPSEASKGRILFFEKDKIERNFFFNSNKISKDGQKPNYVFIIDEINRGNIAQIFGELITLIEISKREGEQEEMKAILPYSKEIFSVPGNLYIIGTMNTADRSVEALDSALRRRFSFIEMMPDVSFIDSNPVNGIDLQKLLLKINERLEVLLSKEHTIGHTYLLDIKVVSDLKHTFKNKIIPLLKEYFYGDFGKISMVIGSDFVYQDKTQKPKFLGEYLEMIEEYTETKPWKFADIETMDNNTFVKAIKQIYE